MRIFQVFIIAVLTLGMYTSCSSQENKGEGSTNISNGGKAGVYYFHYTRRCATCNAVEKVSKDAIAELYGDEVSFASYNLDTEAGKNKAEKLGVSGQTLLIVADNQKVNITNEAFMNARGQADKLRAIIKEKIDGLMNE